MQLGSKLEDVGTTIFTVMSRLAEECGAINLGQGFPDFDPPPELCDALARHIREGKNQYAPMAGVLRLREQIAAGIQRSHGRVLDPVSEITVTSGATEGIFDVVMAFVRPGDEVIVLDPCYDSYEPSVRLAGARTRHVPLTLRSFRIDFERLRAAFNPRTRLLILNFPHNPSGSLLSAQDLDQLAECLRPSNAFVLSDEVYEHIVYDGGEHQSVLRHPELAERSLVVGSFGKAYHATGWKVGWVAAPRALNSEVRKVHQFVTFSTFTAAQEALADMLEQQPGHLKALSGYYQAKRDQFRELLSSSLLELLPVGGAYFQLADYSAVADVEDRRFAEWLAREIGVAAIPISPFYAEPPPERLLRFCFAKQSSTLEAAAERLLRLSPLRT